MNHMWTIYWGYHSLEIHDSQTSAPSLTIAPSHRLTIFNGETAYFYKLLTSPGWVLHRTQNPSIWGFDPGIFSLQQEVVSKLLQDLDGSFVTSSWNCSWNCCSKNGRMANVETVGHHSDLIEISLKKLLMKKNWRVLPWPFNIGQTKYATCWPSTGPTVSNPQSAIKKNRAKVKPAKIHQKSQVCEVFVSNNNHSKDLTNCQHLEKKKSLG